MRTIFYTNHLNSSASFFKRIVIKQFSALLLPLFVSLNLLAQVAPVTPPAGGFKIDGYLRANVPSQHGDWVPRLNSQTFTAGIDSFVMTSNGAVEDLVATRWKTDLYNSQSDSIFAQGSKFNDYISALHWSTGSAPDKNDINNGLFYASGNPSNGDQWIMIAGDRLAVNGTSYIDFEFLQAAVTINSNGTFSSTGPAGGRTLGDINISMEYNNGGTAPKVVIYRWKQIGSVYQWDSSGSAAITDAFAQTNTLSVDVPFGAFGSTTYQAYAFVEAAVNITQLLNSGAAGNCQGINIKALWIKTKASSSSTAALKDFMSPIAVDLSFGGVSIDQKGPYCVNADPITLTGTPSGGTFSGPGVTGDQFDPETAGVGHHRIIYTASAGVNCEKKDTMYIDVNPLPSLTPSIDPICEGTATSYLKYTGLTNGGTHPQYKITWTSGPTSMSDYVSLPASPVTIPKTGSFASLSAATYSGTLYVRDSATGCANEGNSVSLVVNANPSQPGLDVTQPTCGNSNGTVKVTSPLDDATHDYEYSNNGGTYQDDVNFTVASGASYSIVARNKTTNCTSAATTGTMGSATQTPAATAIITQDVSCSRSTGTVKIVQASEGNPDYDNSIYEFSNDGTNFGSNPEFQFSAGGGYSLTVRRKSDHTCTQTASCEAEQQTIARVNNAEQVAIELNSKPTVVAAPNPFNDRIRFSLKSNVSGQGRLEIYNTLGQKIKTVFQGFVKAGELQTVEYSVPGSQRANLIYVFSVGDEQATGKLIQLK